MLDKIEKYDEHTVVETLRLKVPLNMVKVWKLDGTPVKQVRSLFADAKHVVLYQQHAPFRGMDRYYAAAMNPDLLVVKIPAWSKMMHKERRKVGEHSKTD